MSQYIQFAQMIPVATSDSEGICELSVPELEAIAGGAVICNDD